MLRQAVSKVAVSLTILMLSVSAALADVVLDKMPADILFCARVNNLNQATGALDQYLMGISPRPISSGGLIKGALGMMFGNFELKGFDANGSFAIFATAESSKSEPELYFLLPVTDYKQIIDPNFRVSPPDDNGVSAVGTGPARQFFIKQIDKSGLMSNDYRKLCAMASTISDAKSAKLTSALEAAQAKQAAGEPVWCYVNMAKVWSLYGSEISKGIEEMKKEVANPGAKIQERIDNLEQTKSRMATADPNNPSISRISAQIESLKAQKKQMAGQKNPQMFGQIFDFYGVFIKDFMQQSKSVTLVCNPKPSVLNFNIGFNALAGTEMAKILTVEAGKAAKNPLIGYAEDGTAMNMVGRIDHTMTKKTYLWFIDVFSQASGKDINSPDIVKTKKLTSDIIDALGDFAVCSFSIDPNAKPPFDIKYVLQVKDANLFNKTNDEFIKIWPDSVFGSLYKNMGMDCNFAIKRGVDKYKGVSIDSAAFSMKFNEANMPEAKMLNAMYGNGFEYRWAIVDGLWVCRITNEPNAVYKLIDQVKAGASQQAGAEMQKAMSLVPDADKDDFIVTYNVLRFLKYIQAFAPMPFAMPDVATKSNIVVAGKAASGSVSIDIAAPKEHIMEISKAFQEMDKQGMQQQQQMQQAPMQTKPAPVPPPAPQ
jgi:desulfoferrodoxin (superoxide reductase-like protein)